MVFEKHSRERRAGRVKIKRSDDKSLKHEPKYKYVHAEEEEHEHLYDKNI